MNKHNTIEISVIDKEEKRWNKLRMVETGEEAQHSTTE